MKFKSALITSGGGSVGGVTLSRNRFGMYFRGRAMPVDPATTFQTAVRNALATLATRWQDVLTTVQRTAWETYAQNVTVLNSLGDPIVLTGLMMYVRCNTPRIQNSISVVDAAPTTFNLGTFTPPVITVSEATQAASVAFDDTDDWANEDDASLLVQASRQVSPAVNFFKGPYRLAGDIRGNSVTPPTDPTAIASPFAVTEDNRQYFRVAVIRADGRLSSALRTFADIAA